MNFMFVLEILFEFHAFSTNKSTQKYRINSDFAKFVKANIGSERRLYIAFG